MNKKWLLILYAVSGLLFMLTLFYVLEVFRIYDEPADIYRNLRDGFLKTQEDLQEETDFSAESKREDAGEALNMWIFQKNNRTFVDMRTGVFEYFGKRKKEAKALNSEDAPISVDWENLYQLNPDLTGWLYIEALQEISYPIVQAADDAYYSNHTFTKEESSAGCVFLTCTAAADYSSPYSIIYGHNMRDGSMFSNLFQIKNQAVLNESPDFWILTPDENLRYQIVSIIEVERSSELYLRAFSRWTESFFDWEKDISRASLISSENLPLTDHDRITALVTCVPQSFNRLVVFGLLQE